MNEGKERREEERMGIGMENGCEKRIKSFIIIYLLSMAEYQFH